MEADLELAPEPRARACPAAAGALGLRLATLVLVALLALAAPARPAGLRPLTLNELETRARAAGLGRENAIRILRISYAAHNGASRFAYVLLPRWYGPGHDPPIPLVISPHGRGVPALGNASLWGNLPAIGRFAVVCPEGQGRRLRLYAWGAPGDIADLARMPQIVARALPFLHIEPHRIYAFGSSMGAQETLLLVARAPHLLAGAAAFDADTNLAERYRMFADLPFGRSLQRKLVEEVGATPSADPGAYLERSPLYHALQIARSGVPLQIWWSRNDRVVRDQNGQSGRLYRTIRRLNPAAEVVQVVGSWRHSVEFDAVRRLPLALSAFALMPVRGHAPLGAAAKRALGLPPGWAGPPLSLGLRALPPGLVAHKPGSPGP